MKLTAFVYVSISAKGRIHWKTAPRTCEDLRFVRCIFPLQASLIIYLFIEHWTSSFESFIGTSRSESQFSKSRSEAKSEWRTGRGIQQAEATNQLGVGSVGQIWWQCHMQSLKPWIGHRKINQWSIHPIWDKFHSSTFSDQLYPISIP